MTTEEIQIQNGPASVRSVDARVAATAGLLRVWWLAVEFIGLFVAVPLLIYLDVLSLQFAMPMLLLFAIGVTLWLLFDPTFDRRQLWSPGRLGRQLRGMLVVFAIGGLGLLAYTALFERDHLLSMPLERPRLWIMIMLLYPLFSVYPQEVIYRTLLFHRYAALFRHRWVMILASAAAFGYMHLIFENPLAVLLTFIGGVIFARTYDKTRSTFVVSVEHALFGDLIFTIGLGMYFYTGNVGG